MGSTFAAQFLAGLQAGRAEQERKRHELEQMALQRQGIERQGRFDARTEALQNLELMRSLPAPEQELPAGVAGPPAQLSVPKVQIPGLTAGAKPLEVQPTTLTDLLTQQRAAEDVKAARELEQKKAEREAARIPVTPEVSALFGGALPVGPVDPALANLAAAGFRGQEERKTREQIARERGADRAEAAAARRADKEAAAAEKRTALDEAADAYIEAGTPLEAIPRTVRDIATKRAQAKGVKLLTRKDHDIVQDIDAAADEAKNVLARWQEGFTGVGGLIPERLAGEKRAEFNAALGKLASKIRHDMSGAAVSASEAPYLERWIPSKTDSDTQVVTKLKTLIATAEARKAIYTGARRASPGANESESPAPVAEPLQIEGYTIKVK